MMKYKRIIVGITLLVVGLGSLGIRTSARERADIVQISSAGNQVDIYTVGLQGYESAEAQIGRRAVEVSSYEEIVDGHLIILMDNSLSIKKKDREKINEIIKQLVEKKESTLKISIAIYGEDIQYIIEDETESSAIMDAWNSIAYQNRDTYLTDVLYDELAGLKGQEGYTSFLLITDGVDNKAIGYTKEELTDSLKKTPYPVYSIGASSKTGEALENLFALSRLTHAEYYLLDDYVGNYEQIIEGILEPIGHITLQVPEQILDGSTQNILLTIKTTAGETKLSSEAKMDFSLESQETPEETPEVVEELILEKEPTPEPEPELTQLAPAIEDLDTEPEKSETSIDFVTVGAIIVVIAVILFLLIRMIPKKKSGRKKKNEKKEEDAELGVTEFNIDNIAAQEDSNATVFLARENTRQILVLRDAEDPAKVFRYPLKDRVVIGRRAGDGVNIVLNYESSVSGKHCEISVSGNRYYIADLNSSNGTSLNGRAVVGATEFTPGSTIKLGKLVMVVDIEQIAY